MPEERDETRYSTGGCRGPRPAQRHAHRTTPRPGTRLRYTQAGRRHRLMDSTGTTSLATVAARAVRAFADAYGRQPDVAWSAPGRANLIGEHTDYNDGFVLPFAITQRTVAAAARRD